MLKKLDELGLINHVPYRGVRLTADGPAPRARGDPPPPADRELPGGSAGHALGSGSRRGGGARARALGGSRGADRGQARAPHRRPPRRSDPHRRAELQEPRRASWTSLQPGDQGVFVRVSDSDPEMLRYLAGRGISPGDRFTVRERQPFGGPLFVLFGEREHALGGQLARAHARGGRHGARPQGATGMREGTAMATDGHASPPRLAAPPLTEEDAARSRDRSRVARRARAPQALAPAVAARGSGHPRDARGERRPEHDRLRLRRRPVRAGVLRAIHPACCSRWRSSARRCACASARSPTAATASSCCSATGSVWGWFGAGDLSSPTSSR